jgi:hypothetical protein
MVGSLLASGTSQTLLGGIPRSSRRFVLGIQNDDEGPQGTNLLPPKGGLKIRPAPSFEAAWVARQWLPHH